MRHYKFMRLSTSCLALVALLSACGGGASGASSPTTPAPVVPVVPAADISVSFSPASLDNISVTTSDVSIQVLDANRNVLKNAPVTVRVLDSSASWNASATNSGTTGVLTGVVNLGDNLANREVTLLVNSGTVTKQTKLMVAGATLTATASAASVNSGQEVSIVFRLRKSGQPLTNQSIQIRSSLGSFSTTVAQMNSSGEYTLSYITSVTGTDVITANAGGASVSTSISIGTVTTPTPSAVPASFGLQATPSVIQQGAPNSLITVTVKGASNQNIKDARVRFRIADPNNIGGSLNATSSVATQVVYTDVNGVATVTYYPGNISSPTDGLSICAQVLNPTIDSPYPGVVPSNTDTRPGFCTDLNEGGRPLTISVVPVSITIGENNEIISGQGGLTYIKQYIVTVTNSSGAPQSGALVSAYLDVEQYRKGDMIWATAIDPDGWVINNLRLCNNEDRNRNGVLDPGEDSTDELLFPEPDWSGNGNGVLDPRIPVVVRALNNGLTNSSGFVTFEIEYPENYALWAQVRLTVSTLVGGTEGRASVNFILPAMASDYTSQGVPPAGVVSPFGTNTATCRAP